MLAKAFFQERVPMFTRGLPSSAGAVAQRCFDRRMGSLPAK
jgi:hypothetical protein